MKYVFILLTCCLSSSIVCAQDSTVYYQENAISFNNEYIFYSDNTFKHYYYTDDGQVWYGKGAYFDRRKSRILKFEEPDSTFSPEQVKVHYESGFKRKLKWKSTILLSEDYYNTTNKGQITLVEFNEE
ncbi:hypothetical protein [Fulvivirga ligni]|uniref:hypothetical protein n=1 Tax=Fulvivirga ligni TaxID=2904246 RepID=UPI001F2A4B93|nr:hypothetical protein [Fulvivirga ligni]UII24259.1 hypothetical protein LVD16_13640 [Fulvivirga ligni]